MSDLVDITDEEFARITEVVHTRFGIDLSKKRTLIRGRLNGTLRTLGYSSFEQYMTAVDDDASGQRLLEMVDRLSTNHTFFFRESDHLDFLTEIALPDLWGPDEESGLRDARIWCAGCATGEEPYSILIALADKYGITREEQDEIAARSHINAINAIDEGRFKEEIVPVTVRSRKKEVVVDTDEHPRPETTIEAL
ncbi:MAG: CheR family methyltransferase, partial [Spirochaetota bacterium]